MLVAEADQGAAPCGSGPSSSPPRSSLAPLGARAADLVVWWEKGFYPEEDAGGPRDRRRLRAEDRQAGRARPPSARCDMPAETAAAIEAGQPARLPVRHGAVEPTVRAVGPRGPARRPHGRPRPAWRPSSTRTRSTAPPCSTRRTGRRGLYALPMGRDTNHVHVWRSLLERAGFTLADIPKEWEPFWSFWCDQVQPAVRKATRPRRRLGRRPAHVGRGGRHRRSSSCSSCTPTRPTT